MRGMFRHMADTAVFTECQTGQRWPVSMERDYRALESAYLQVQRQPGEELLVSLDGQVALKPEVNGAAPGPTLIAERYVGIWPGESCGSTLATASLFETYWKLTRLESKPVIVTESQREPRVIFRARQNQVVGFGGCNSFAGTFRLSAGAMTVTGIAATQKACSYGMDTEAALFSALYRVRSWRIIGQHLELSDAGGKILARLEARASR
jgi:copper homeostasis protein (lipoprotein)